MRLIDADRLRNIAISNRDVEMVYEIDHSPTVERPHGEWIPFEWSANYSTKIPLPKGSNSHMEEYWDEEFICSVCGKEHHARNFCPNCGADMREGESN